MVVDGLQSAGDWSDFNSFAARFRATAHRDLISLYKSRGISYSSI